MGPHKNGAKTRSVLPQNLPVTIKRKNSEDLLNQFLKDTKVPMPEGLKERAAKMPHKARHAPTRSTRAGNKIIEHIT
jgi:hypothetical protein